MGTDDLCNKVKPGVNATCSNAPPDRWEDDLPRPPTSPDMFRYDRDVVLDPARAARAAPLEPERLRNGKCNTCSLVKVSAARLAARARKTN